MSYIVHTFCKLVDKHMDVRHCRWRIFIYTHLLPFLVTAILAGIIMYICC